MKKLLSLGLVALGVSSTPLTAALYDDLNTYGLLGRQVNGRNPLVDSFDIEQHGFTPGAEVAIWGEATFMLADADKRYEEFSIQLGNVDGFDDGKINDFSILGVTFELAGGSVATLLADINADGILSYEITALSGDFNVLWANLVVCTEDINTTNRVPDGGLTLAFLGASVVGLYAFRRKE